MLLQEETRWEAASADFAEWVERNHLEAHKVGTG